VDAQFDWEYVSDRVDRIMRDDLRGRGPMYRWISGRRYAILGVEPMAEKHEWFDSYDKQQREILDAAQDADVVFCEEYLDGLFAIPSSRRLSDYDVIREFGNGSALHGLLRLGDQGDRHHDRYMHRYLTEDTMPMVQKAGIWNDLLIATDASEMTYDDLCSARILLAYLDQVWPLSFPEADERPVTTEWRSMIQATQVRKEVTNPSNYWKHVLVVVSPQNGPGLLRTLRDPSTSLTDLMYHTRPRSDI